MHRYITTKTEAVINQIDRSISIETTAVIKWSAIATDLRSVVKSFGGWLREVAVMSDVSLAGLALVTVQP
jgi:hypothetical protein